MEDSDSISKNPYNLYMDFTTKLFAFQMHYGLSVFNSWTRAFEATSSMEDMTGKKIQNTIRSTFNEYLQNNLRDEKFSKSLSDLVESYTEFAPTINHDKLYKYLESININYDRKVEPIRDTINRTSSKVIPMKGKFEIHHYPTSIPKKFKTPLLVVGSLINRHYILDLLPATSIIRYFQELGFDVYATDWRMPSIQDEDMSLANYAHEYLENAVDKVEEITGSRNVNLFGYCWGGILSLLYSALHPQNVKNLILHATPVDFGKPPTVLESWLKDLDIKQFVDTFGNVPSSFLNIAFLLRNPLEAVLKYVFYFGQPRTTKEVKQFLAVESWLYDSVPIIGTVFEKIITDIYKKNLLIQNKMMLDKNLIDLKKINMPVLNIVGTRDDLVSAESSRTITKVISSKDKKTLEFPTGHVGLCISRAVHKKLWPEVGEWLKKHNS